METSKQKETNNLDLLTAIEYIADKAKGSGLSAGFYRKANQYIKYVTEKMELTKEQSVMLALFVDNSDSTNISIGDLGQFLECRTTRLLRYMVDIDVLENRELVRCSRSCHRKSYRVPAEVIEALKQNEKYVPKNYSGLSCAELFCEIENILDLRQEEELTYETTVEKINNLLDCNKHIIYVQKVLSYNFNDEDKMLLILFSHLFVNNNDNYIRFHDLDFLYDDKREWSIVKSKLNRGDHVLLKGKIVEYNNCNGMVDRESFRMTNDAKRELFVELHLPSMDEKSGDVIKFKDITPKKMFYGDKVECQIDELGNLLNDEQYNQIRTRMTDTGFRCGFTCLFYGAPEPARPKLCCNWHD